MAQPEWKFTQIERHEQPLWLEVSDTIRFQLDDNAIKLISRMRLQRSRMASV